MLSNGRSVTVNAILLIFHNFLKLVFYRFLTTTFFSVLNNCSHSFVIKVMLPIHRGLISPLNSGLKRVEFEIVFMFSTFTQPRAELFKAGLR